MIQKSESSFLIEFLPLPRNQSDFEGDFLKRRQSQKFIGGNLSRINELAPAGKSNIWLFKWKKNSFFFHFRMA